MTGWKVPVLMVLSEAAGNDDAQQGSSGKMRRGKCGENQSIHVGSGLTTAAALSEVQHNEPLSTPDTQRVPAGKEETAAHVRAPAWPFESANKMWLSCGRVVLNFEFIFATPQVHEPLDKSVCTRPCQM